MVLTFKLKHESDRLVFLAKLDTIISTLNLTQQLGSMAIWVVDFSNGGYKIRKIFA